MRMRYLIEIICFACLVLCACLDDHTSLGDRELSEITISADRDTLTAYFGEEFVMKSLQVEQSGEELPLTYEWSYGTLNLVNEEMASYPIKDSLHVVSHDPELKYAFRELGTFGLRLRVENGQTVRYKYFVLHVDTEFGEGITVLSRDETGKGRISFMRPLTKEEINDGEEPVFRTDIMDLINPMIEMEDVTDMVQAGNRLLVCSGNTGRIYNMDSRTFDIEGMTSFKGTFPGCAFINFAGISSQNNMYLVSEDRRGYVYDFMLDELVLTDYFEELNVDAAVACDQPIGVDYETSTFYSPKTGGVNSSLARYADFDILSICPVGTKMYVIATHKLMPSYLYLSWTTSSLGNPTILHLYDASLPIKVNRNTLLAGSNPCECLYYTCDDGIYCWDLKQKLPTTPVIQIPSGMEVTSLSMDAEEKLLYVGLYEKDRVGELKGHLYIYDVKTAVLVNKYHEIADKPVKIVYKKRV